MGTADDPAETYNVLITFISGVLSNVYCYQERHSRLVLITFISGVLSNQTSTDFTIAEQES